MAEERRHSLLQSFAEHRDALLRVLKRRLGNAARAEDLTQEAWLRAAAGQNRQAPLPTIPSMESTVSPSFAWATITALPAWGRPLSISTLARDDCLANVRHGRGRRAVDIFVQARFPVHSGRILGLPGRILVSVMGRWSWRRCRSPAS